MAGARLIGSLFQEKIRACRRGFLFRFVSNFSLSSLPPLRHFCYDCLQRLRVSAVCDSTVLFEKLMDGCNLFAFIYLFIYFFCFVIYTKYYIIYLLIDTLTGYKLSKYIIKRNIFLYLYIFFTLYFILLLYPQLY